MLVFGPSDHWDRRSFLGSAGALFVSALSPKSVDAMAVTEAVVASAYRLPNGKFGVATLTECGEIVHRYDLPERGHDLVWSPDKTQIVAFARRPGVFAAVIDVNSVRAPFVFSAPEGRHFYGHGVFSENGQLLYVTENDFENARGVIGIYDASKRFGRIGELNSHGVGPHDMEILPDGRTLVIANGGIETHPEFGRSKLNISTMKSNLSFIDVETGELRARYELPRDLHQVSIRHLAMMDDDTVWFACQNEGDQAQLVPLVGRISLSGGNFSTVDLPEAVLVSLRGYVGSIAGNSKTAQIAVSSPRGHVAHILDAQTGNLLVTQRMADICGVAGYADDFRFSTGRGFIGERKSEFGWDNHLSAKPT